MPLPGPTLEPAEILENVHDDVRADPQNPQVQSSNLVHLGGNLQSIELFGGWWYNHKCYHQTTIYPSPVSYQNMETP
uniref:Uncharacterized protein n=1 Tax=Rhizophora mucronata TaxID=61149 RepID=A0A2P2JNW0_RHIMU